MSDYTDGHESAEWRAVVISLEKLLKKEGRIGLESAYAHVAHSIRYRDWLEDHRVTLFSSSHICLYRLLGKRCPSDRCNAPGLIPGADHCDEWRRDKRTMIITSQPYALSLEVLRGTVALCDQYALDVQVRAGSSWHFPGNSLLVEYTCKEER